jgi:hypothetical protein
MTGGTPVPPNDPNGFVLEFGHLVIGDYLGFGIYNLEFQPLRRVRNEKKIEIA